ncbi:penicillin-binding protein [Mailhella massiliensis]|uniref:Transpeptidase family protein n=1 Tax=Mailhella massiliensis TaxID=1903261 RepID=A0A921DQB5_9BACT|nr:penicillin-binding protein [Mailhella massiliensis]HJD96274.1 transpeptidase family protein [Mailhella massiliensis]
MRPNSSSSSSPRLPGRRRANRRLPASQPSAAQGKGLFARLRARWVWLLGQRFHYAAALFIVCWVLLWLRAFEVQVLLGPVYGDMAERQHTYTEVIEGARGSILDRNGRVLARSVACQSVYANPRVMEDINDAAKRLAPLLKRSPDELAAVFRKNRAFIWLARKVDDATATAIQKEGIPGIGLSREFERVYPYRHLAGQLLGFVGVDSHGLEGVELAYDERLRGTSVKSRVSRNAAEQILNRKEEPSEQRGEDITLTIDVQVQFIAEDVIADAVRASGAHWGGVLVSEVESGEILAWAQYPFFNPNNYREASSSVYRNRLAGDGLEPGSTFKPLVMATALEEKLVTPETRIFCENGVWRTRYAPIRDDTHAYGELTATEIISRSSNIGMAKIGLTLGVPKLHSYLSRLGFGQRTGIGIHESRGILRAPRNWSELDLMSASFGQSLSVTGIQMLQAYTILADGGEFRPLRLVMDEPGQSETASGQRIFSKKTTRTVLKMMEETVDGNGTGTRARIPGLRVAGKTGTAQKADKSGRGYSRKRLASFGGIVPADAPRYVIYVMLDEPTTTGYGGAIAAPVFQKVASRTLAYNGYLPDVTFAMAEQAQERALTPAQREQRRKDAIYLANLAKYRAEKARKERERALKMAGKALADNTLMPNLQGLTLRKTIETCVARGIIPTMEGSGTFVLRQSPAPGSRISEDSTCTVWLTDTLPHSETSPSAAKE